MSRPLATLSPSDQNSKLHSHAKIDQRNGSYEEHTSTTTIKKQNFVYEDREDGDDDDGVSDPPSSPFVADVKSRNATPSPKKLSSPNKTSHIGGEEGGGTASSGEPTLRYNEGLTRAIDAMSMNVDTEEGENSILHYDCNNETLSTIHNGAQPDDEDNVNDRSTVNMDDTCLSTFSAVPNADMTRFAQLGTPSPTKTTTRDNWSPGKQLRQAQYSNISTPGTARSRAGRTFSDEDDDNMSASHTPRRPNNGTDATTTNLLDFTDQFNTFAHSLQVVPHSPRIPTRGGSRNHRSSPSKSQSQFQTSPTRCTPSPAKHRPLPPSTPSELRNILDFDIPPAPTPRSIPTITPRELETLKSSFLSQISNLTASLRGKEAEVAALMSSVTDAERRVGEAAEEVREHKGARERAEEEKEDLLKRGKDMEAMLRSTRDEVRRGEGEREILTEEIGRGKRLREGLEERMKGLETELRDARAQMASSSSSPTKNDRMSTDVSSADTAAAADGTTSTPNATDPNKDKEIADAVEKVARELHTLYKGKHETKVAALKKSYEVRWEKKIRELEKRLEEMKGENERLRESLEGRDATLSGVMPGTLSGEAGVGGDGELRVRVTALEREISALSADNDSLRRQLEAERAEKGDLVATVEEMLLVQQEGPEALEEEAPGTAQGEMGPPSQRGERIERGLENLRSSVRRASGLKLPGSAFGGGSGSGGGESRIGRAMGTGTHGHGGRTRSRSGSRTRGGTAIAVAPRSGIMTSIERMGRGAGA